MVETYSPKISIFVLGPILGPDDGRTVSKRRCVRVKDTIHLCLNAKVMSFMPSEQETTGFSHLSLNRYRVNFKILQEYGGLSGNIGNQYVIEISPGLVSFNSNWEGNLFQKNQYYSGVVCFGVISYHVGEESMDALKSALSMVRMEGLVDAIYGAKSNKQIKDSEALEFYDCVDSIDRLRQIESEDEIGWMEWPIIKILLKGVKAWK